MNKFETEAMSIVLGAIPSNDYAVFIFGSRASETYKESSDLDIGILGNKPFPFEKFLHIKSLLEESNVPYKTDLVDFYSAPQEFKSVALKKIRVWHCPQNITID